VASGSLPLSFVYMSASAIPRLPELHHDNSGIEHTDVLASHLNWSGSTTNTPGYFHFNAHIKLTFCIRSEYCREQVNPTTYARATSSCCLHYCHAVLALGNLWRIFCSRGHTAKRRFRRLRKEESQEHTFFITQIGAIVNLIVGSLFSTSILRYSQGWMAPKEHISFFHVSLILAFRTHRFPWSLSDRKYLLSRKRWIRAALVLAFIYALTFITPGVTTLLTPLPIPQWAPLNGTELGLLAKPKRYRLPRMAQ
jgi:hypothetical protein